MNMRTIVFLLLLGLAASNLVKVSRRSYSYPARFLVESSGESGEDSGESSSSSTGTVEESSSSSTGTVEESSSSSTGTEESGSSSSTATDESSSTASETSSTSETESSTAASEADKTTPAEIADVKVTVSFPAALDDAGKTSLKDGYADAVSAKTGIHKDNLVVVLVEQTTSSGRRLLAVEYVLSAFAAKSLVDSAPALDNSTMTSLSEAIVTYAKDTLDVDVTIEFTPDVVVTAPTTVPRDTTGDSDTSSSSTGTDDGNDGDENYNGAHKASLSVFACASAILAVVAM